MTAKIGVITFPGTLDDVDADPLEGDRVREDVPVLERLVDHRRRVQQVA